MPKELRSEDFVDGLQTAYKAIYKLQERLHGKDAKRILTAAMVEIDKVISDSTEEESFKFILP